MKMEAIVCAFCGEKSEKSAAELKRQRKRGRTEFFCDLSCTGKSPERVDRLREYQKLSDYDITQHAGNRMDEFSLFRRHLRRAIRRKPVCNLTLEHLKDIWTGTCALTGLSIQITHEENSKGKDHRTEASLDRVDSEQGYVIGNVQWTSATANFAKGKLTQEQILEWISEIRG